MNKIELTKKLIDKMPLYFSYNAIRENIRKETAIEDSTLLSYLSREVSAGDLWSAGKGWYSKQEKEFLLNTEPVQEIIKMIKQKFPLLECSCWSTEQINSFTHHMLGKHIIFVYVDSEAVSPVHEILVDNEYNSFMNPNKTVLKKAFRITGKTVIVRPAIARQPKNTKGASPIEKILVDLIFENRKLNIIQSDELRLIIENIMKSGVINVASVISYMKQREMSLDAVIKEIRIFNNPEILDYVSVQEGA